MLTGMKAARLAGMTNEVLVRAMWAGAEMGWSAEDLTLSATHLCRSEEDVPAPAASGYEVRRRPVERSFCFGPGHTNVEFMKINLSRRCCPGNEHCCHGPDKCLGLPPYINPLTPANVVMAWKERQMEKDYDQRVRRKNRRMAREQQQQDEQQQEEDASW
jgi:hypothetical protein